MKHKKTKDKSQVVAQTVVKLSDHVFDHLSEEVQGHRPMSLFPRLIGPAAGRTDSFLCDRKGASDDHLYLELVVRKDQSMGLAA